MLVLRVYMMVLVALVPFAWFLKQRHNWACIQIFSAGAIHALWRINNPNAVRRVRTLLMLNVSRVLFYIKKYCLLRLTLTLT